MPQRRGNAAPFAAPRNAYQASDGRWLGLSGTTQSIAVRVMRIVGRPDLIDEPWFVDHTGLLEHADELDEAIQAWISGHTTEEVLAAFEEQEGAIAPIYSIAEIVEDPHYLARETVTSVPHPQLGPLLMQNVIPGLTATPGRIGHAGAALREHNVEILCGELGVTEEELASLTADGVVADVPAPVPSTGEDAE